MISIITKKSKKRLMVYIFLWIPFILFISGCADNKVESICEDPIDESHLGLQWLSSGSLGQHLAIDFWHLQELRLEQLPMDTWSITILT